MSEHKHTPGPYVVAFGKIYAVRGERDNVSIIKADRDSEKTSPTERAANIAFACLAMNSHADLLAACEDFMEMIGALAEDAREAGYQGRADNAYALARKTRAAIARATGKP